MSKEQTIAIYQPLLQAIAYKIVRCKADAEDIVQETFLKWLSSGPKKIENTKAYLITAVKNNCLNHLNALRRKKEELFQQNNISEIIPDLKSQILLILIWRLNWRRLLKLFMPNSNH
jgi:RNA polymerase sigma factor (sigma-70 family)